MDSEQEGGRREEEGELTTTLERRSPSFHLPPPSSLSYERKVFRLALLGGLPAVVVSITLLIREDYTPKVVWTLAVLIFATWIIIAALLRERVVRPLQTLSNLLGALREGDYSIRARGADRDDALGLAFLEANVLGETLRSQRLGDR